MTCGDTDTLRYMRMRSLRLSVVGCRLCDAGHITFPSADPLADSIAFRSAVLRHPHPHPHPHSKE
ncbi:hypothetical protein GCM10009680_46630 [Streptomyces yatensis]|uniref:Uncharacterized protein n=1 Tax=Streptomyces yatensis TaxID=155177 RepID=A0ABP4UB77_9ACTN